MMGEESIYNLIPIDEQKRLKEKRYVSKFKTNVKDETTQNKASYKTMGPSNVSPPSTDFYLKKHEKEPILPSKTDFKYTDSDNRRPSIPKQDDKPLMGLKTTKNFIKTNAVQNITSVPRRPEKIFVDTKKGDKHLLLPSGLEPMYLHRKDYGEVPEYLTKRKEEIERAQEEYDSYVAENFRRGAMKSLSENEREMILHGLKENWEEIHHQYQGLSVVTDTAPKKNRKERMEAEMKQLERDIETMEKHRVIYIAN